EPAGDTGADPLHLAEGEGSARPDEVGAARPVEQRHDEVCGGRARDTVALVGARVVDADDVGVGDAGHREGLAPEPSLRRRLDMAVEADPLDGDVALEPQVPRAPHLPHRADPDALVEAVAAGEDGPVARVLDRALDRVGAAHRTEGSSPVSLTICLPAAC